MGRWARKIENTSRPLEEAWDHLKQGVYLVSVSPKSMIGLLGPTIMTIAIKKTRTFWRGGPAERLSDGPVYDPRNRV